MNLEVDQFEGFLTGLAQIIELDFEIWDVDGTCLFSSDRQIDEPETFKSRTMSSRIIEKEGFVSDTTQRKFSLYGIPIANNGEIIGTLIGRSAGFQPRDQSQDIKIQESVYRDKIEAFLSQMAGIIEDKMAGQAETEELAMELSQSFEDLSLYSRIKTHGSTLHFNETMLKDLVEDLRSSMRTELAFTIMPELKQYDAFIYNEELKDKIPDMETFARTLIDTIPSDAPSLTENYYIINDSRQSEEYRALHSDPYRFLAVAIQQDDIFFGWLGMFSFNMNEIFRNSELWLLKSLASSTAAAFENTSLYAESLRMAEKERFARNIFQKYVPEEVANEILDLGDRDLIKLGEKKLLTLLNVDIRGYSKMSKKVRAEDMVEVLNHFFMVMGTAIIEYKGILDKYLGDGLLAIFGAPVASPNPALDATLAAMEMVENLEKVNEYAADRFGMPLKIGISINTGEAIVGNIGFEKKMDYTVIGDVVNDTFRLQDLTKEKSNSIFISETTYLQVKSIIQTRSLGVRALESNENKMVVYEVIDERKASDLRTADPQ